MTTPTIRFMAGIVSHYERSGDRFSRPRVV
jgi:hypothetical protein